jgi:aconitase A
VQEQVQQDRIGAHATMHRNRELPRPGWHCDHLIRAHVGATQDLMTARDENQEVYDFLKSVSVKHSLNADQIEWFKAGSALNRLGSRRF